MKLELYFAPGACSFVPHVSLEAIKSATGQAFEPRLVKLHKNEQRTPEFLAMNPNGQVPVLIADGRPLARLRGHRPEVAAGLHVERVMAAPSVAAALERERVRLDTYKAA